RSEQRKSAQRVLHPPSPKTGRRVGAGLGATAHLVPLADSCLSPTGLCSFRMLDLLEQKKVDEPLEGTDCEPIVCPRPQRRQGCEGLPGVTPIIDFMSFVIRSIAVMACRSSIEVTTCGDSAGFSVVTTQGWM